MGTKVHCKSFLPGYYSMRDLNEDSSSSSWPQLNGDKVITNGQYIDGFLSKTKIDRYPVYDKDVLKEKMLEHETVFRNQVYELHRVYRLQRDMMEEVRRNELQKRASMDASSASSLQGFQMPSEMPYYGYGRTSILGVEIANSPTICMKRNDSQSSHFLFQNQFSSKECGALDSRPSKVRKKLFDLQLPAEVYVDSEDGEDVQEYKVPYISRYTPDGNGKAAPENRIMSSIGSSGVKVDGPAGVSASGARLRVSVGLADLNEPIYVEESLSPLLVEVRGHTSTNGESKVLNLNQSASSNTGFLGVTHDGLLGNSSLYSRVTQRGPVSHIYEAGSSNNGFSSNLGSLSQSLRKDKLPLPPYPLQGILNPLHRSPGIYPSLCNREGLQRDGSRYVDFSDRNRPSNISHFEPPVTSQNSYPFFNSHCFTGSHSHPLASWAKPKSSFTEQIIAPESPYNSAAALDRRLLPSAQGQDPFTGKWQVDVSSRLNSCFGGEDPPLNGFCHGSTSGCKKLQVHSQLRDAVVSDKQANQEFGIYEKSSSRKDSKPVRDFNLNEVVSSSSNEQVLLQDLNFLDGKSKPEDDLSVLPWLRPKPIHDHAGDLSRLQASSNPSWCKREAVRDLNEPFILVSTDFDIVRKKEIFGIPTDKEPAAPLASISSTVDCHSEKKNVDTKRKNMIIDINLACEPDEETSDEELAAVEKRIKDACFIDLNSCASDSEDPPVSSIEESKSNGGKATLKIDLEVPVSLESEDDCLPSDENKAETVHDDVLKLAADIMVAISSSFAQEHAEDTAARPSEATLADSLLRFFDAVSSCAVELRRRDDGDEFEAMTLQLAETNEEDYMPDPFVSEAPIVDDMAANTRVTRARRGQSRRGRQRRDFQRDILPGLTSLSRHEVTEDLQTFGGLMRATGHHWNSGLTRRNGGRNRGARGRRRAVVEAVPTAIPSAVCTPLIQQLSKIEAGLEERSLAGWGKTTRRPRRQRCPSGNPPTVALR